MQSYISPLLMKFEGCVVLVIKFFAIKNGLLPILHCETCENKPFKYGEGLKKHKIIVMNLI